MYNEPQSHSTLAFMVKMESIAAMKNEVKTRKIAQWVKMLAAKSEHMSSIPESHMVEEKWFSKLCCRSTSTHVVAYVWRSPLQIP